MSLKSISPFIASVLLISFTIASGIIVYYFLTTLPKVQTTEVSSQASKVLSCAGAVYEIKYTKICKENLKRGLVFWPRFDEGSGVIAKDSSGNGYNVEIHNSTSLCADPPTPGCVKWVDGKLGYALNFSIFQYQAACAPNLTSYSIANGVTYSVWIRPYYLQSFRVVIFKASGNVPAEQGGIRYGSGSDSRVVCEFYGNRIASTLNLSLNTWSFVACVYEPLGGNKYRVKLYINDTLNTQYSPVTLTEVSRPVLISACDSCYGGCTFLGTIDDPRIYTRALTLDEIKTLYFNGLTNSFNLTFSIFNNGAADLGNNFQAIITFKNGNIITRNFNLPTPLKKGSYQEVVLTIDNYNQTYGEIDKLEVCSLDCPGVCYQIEEDTQC
jgi:hypothetical protein